jgi:hypothetical protein
VTPQELFAVGLRLIGVWFAVSALPEILALNYFGALPGITGLILLTRADLIVQLCYPKGSRKIDQPEKPPRDFRDF